MDDRFLIYNLWDLQKSDREKNCELCYELLNLENQRPDLFKVISLIWNSHISIFSAANILRVTTLL